MILYILLLFVGAWLGFKKGKKSYVGAIMGMAMGICVSFCVMIVMTFILSTTVSKHQQYTEYGKVEIVALRNYESTQGQFFLMSGSIESVPYYFFYYKLPDGGKKLGKVVAENAVIYEEKRSDAYMVKTGTTTIFERTKDWMNWLFLPKFLIPYEETDFTGYAIHVPEGTVRRDIDLDLKNLK